MFKKIECRRVAPLLWEYVSQNLQVDEAMRVAAHVARCEVCRREVEGYRQAVAQVTAYRTEDRPNSRTSWEALRGRIEQENAGARQPVAPRTALRLAWVPAAVALIVVLMVALAPGRNPKPNIQMAGAKGAMRQPSGPNLQPLPPAPIEQPNVQQANKPEERNDQEIVAPRRRRPVVVTPERQLARSNDRAPVRRKPAPEKPVEPVRPPPAESNAIVLADARAPASEHTKRDYVIAAAPTSHAGQSDPAYVIDTLTPSSSTPVSGLDGAMEDAP
jgi:hypothetical protein